MLAAVPKDKIFSAMDREWIHLFLQEKYVMPVKFFFEQLNMPYQVNARKKSEGGQVIIQVNNTTEMQIGDVSDNHNHGF